MRLSLVFTGYMIDLPGRPEPRFPPSLENAVREEIRKRIDGRIRANPGAQMAGFASLARGGDILFHEICREAGIKTAVVLPFPPERFVVQSVEGIPESDWTDRFWRLWNDQERTLSRDAMDLPEADEAYGICNGRILERAQQCGQVHLIALWDGKGGDGPGGTADLVAKAKAAGDNPDVIPPDQLR